MKVSERVCVLVVGLALCQWASAQSSLKKGLQTFPGPLPNIGEKRADVGWDFDLAQEKFFVEYPKAGANALRLGVLVYLSPADDCTAVPQGWESVLHERKLIFIAPQKVGNEQPVSRRMGLAVLAASKLAELTPIDTNRVYVAGFSGGARMASQVAFLYPSLFSGVFAVCGVNYCRPVPKVKATRDDEYGYFELDEKQADVAKQKVKFVLVTGDKDFRYGNILDLYRGGYLKDGYRVKLMDVAGMGHAVCSPKILSDGILVLDKRDEDASRPKNPLKKPSP